VKNKFFKNQSIYSAAIMCLPLSFTDHDLIKWQTQSSRSMILVVSDGMPYSQRSIPDVVAESKRRKIPLKILSDHVGREQTKRCDPILQASGLIQAQGLRHFPTLFFVKDHQLLKQVIPGIQTKTELSLHLDEIF
jgi:hypothetical protein